MPISHTTCALPFHFWPLQMTLLPKVNGRWSDLASKGRVAPKEQDAGLGPDLASFVSPYKQRKHKLGKSTIPTLLKILMYPELQKGRENVYWWEPPLTPVPNLCPEF